MRRALHAITPTDSTPDWRKTNPSYVTSPTRVLPNGWVEIDGGRYADQCREQAEAVARAKPWTSAELAGRSGR